MEVKRSRQALLWAALVALLSHNLVIPVASTATYFDDQMNYYTPDPNAQPPPPVTSSPPPYNSGGGTPPYSSGGGTPPYSSGGGHASPTPSHGTPPHGSGSRPSTPSHGTPSHGSSPPANCGNPPSGGHHHTSPPSSGGYYHSPPPSTPIPDPTTPSTPTPTTPYTPTPTTPYTPTPYTPTPSTPTPTTPYTPTPSTPTDPGTPTTPGITVPSPPFSFDPNSPPFTCNYWRNHPTLIWGLFGWLGPVGNAFGTGTGTGTGTGSGSGALPISGANMSLMQALSNTRTDGIGALYREGTAALLNSLAHTRFPYTTNQVRDSFVRSLSSNRAAAAQAQLFKMANEGRMRPRD